MADIESVFHFSTLCADDAQKCLYFYRTAKNNPLAGKFFTNYSVKLQEPRKCRDLMRGFLDVPKEAITREEKKAFYLAFEDFQFKNFLRIFQGVQISSEKETHNHSQDQGNPISLHEEDEE